jgi:FtsP/CotA-like multicopper oxidase with cupredoxin domain
VHGAVGVADGSDGYAEAWYLPAAGNIPADYTTVGTWFDFFRAKAANSYEVSWEPGRAVFQYPNKNRASTIWYHDHTLGMTRLNVYAGPAGFYLVRGGPAGDDAVLDSSTALAAVLPGPAPKENDKFPPNKTYYEIPIAIQDRSFNVDGSLFYPDTRAFCDSRFLILDFSRIPGVDVWQIGNEGGFLAAPVNITAAGNRLLMSPAERADVIVDFTSVSLGSHVLANVGPDEPFGGGVPGVDFPVADSATTGQIMQFRVVPAVAPDPSTPPQFLVLPPITPLPPATVTRRLALLEELSRFFDDTPVETELGIVSGDPNTGVGTWTKLELGLPVTENPMVGATEAWELYNATADAHPIHIHEVVFEVVNRQVILIDEDAHQVRVDPGSTPTAPEPSETGFKDTVLAYPG